VFTSILGLSAVSYPQKDALVKLPFCTVLEGLSNKIKSKLDHNFYDV
jgi:surfactin synthase thioesterase subunit